MNNIEQMIELSKDRCFSLWFDAATDRYYPDNDRTDGSIWICDVDREITAETILRMTDLVLKVSEELERKGYLKQ